MGCTSSKSAEVRETVRALGNVRTVNEINNQNFENLTKKLAYTILKLSQNKIPEPEASEVIRAFLNGDPSKAFCRLAELRSGK